MFPKNTYINRRQHLAKELNSGVVLLLSNPESPMNAMANTFHFRQDSSFLYFFGLDAPGLAGVIDLESNESVVFGNDVDIDDIIWMGEQPTIADQAAEVGVQKTLPLADLKHYIATKIASGLKIHFLPTYRAEKLLQLEDLTGIHSSRLNHYVSSDLIKAVVKLRSIKDTLEIEEIERACAIGYNMHVTAMKMAKTGTLEQHIAGVVEGISVSGGGMLSFPVILSQDGQTLHNHNHSNLLQNGRMMLTDTGAETAMHYASDHTRTVPVGGKFSQQQREIYNIVLQANMNVIAQSKAGVLYKDMHLLASRTIASGLKDLGLMKGNIDDAVASGAHALFMPHGLGHMMGLDVHDMEDLGENFVGYDHEVTRSNQFGLAYLRLARRLQTGFVITDEPGIYFIPALIDKWKAEKINTDFINFDELNKYRTFGGIRIEDDLLITDDGCKVLGKPIPKTIEEIENTMAE